MDPRQERLKELLKKLAGSHAEPNDQDIEQLVQTRFESAEVQITDEMEAKALERLHKELQDLKALSPAAHPNGRVPDAIRSRIQAIVRPRHAHRRRLAWAGLAVGVSILGIVLLWLASPRPVELGTIASVEGTPEAAGIGERDLVTIHQGMTVRTGTRFETRAGERFEIRFNDGTKFTIEPETTIEIPIEGGFALRRNSDRPQTVNLERGKLWADVRPNESSPLSVSTAMATAKALGTEFGVEVREHLAGNQREAVLIVVSGLVRFFNEHGRVDVPARTQSSATEDSAPTLPEPRRNYTFASVDGTLYAIGGASHGTTSSVAAVEAYDPHTDTWIGRAPLPIASQQLAAGTIDGIIYAVGGCTAQEPLADLQAYDPATNTWTLKLSMPTARSGISATSVAGRLYVLGGSNPFGGPTHFDLVESYDPSTNSWTRGAPLPTSRTGMGVAALNGKLYTVGGSAPGGKNGDMGATMGTVEVYDPQTDTWSSRAPMPTPRQWPTIGVIDGILYAVGGTYMGRWVSTVEAYDPSTDSWKTLPPSPVAFEFNSGGSAAINNGTLYILGRVPELELNPGEPENGNRFHQGSIGVASLTARGWRYSDGDGLTKDQEEQVYCTDPMRSDTDRDGIGDGIEVWLGTDPASADTDGDGVMDWEDPTPLVLGAAGSRIVDALRGLSKRVRRLPLLSFRPQPISDTTARTRREMLADGLSKAADKVASGDRKGAIEWLLLQVRQDDPGTYEMDWMANGEEKAAIATEIQVLVTLLRPR